MMIAKARTKSDALSAINAYLHSSLWRAVIVLLFFHFSTQLLELAVRQSYIDEKRFLRPMDLLFHTIRIFKFSIFTSFTNLNKAKNKIDTE